MDQLGLVQPGDGLGQRVVVAVALAVNRGLAATLGEPLRVAKTDVLRPSVHVANQSIAALGLAGTSEQDCEARAGQRKPLGNKALRLVRR